VVGGFEELALPHVTSAATHIIVAIPGASAEQRDRAIDLAKRSGLQVLTVPSQAELRDEQTGVGLSAAPRQDRQRT
jgi:FlaA1/EpsC-like NDP-sugar epimerase